MGFAAVLTIVFITLKLCDVIDWSWVWVVSPLWIRAIILLTIIKWVEYSENPINKAMDSYNKNIRK